MTQTVTNPLPAHSPMGPSSLKRIIECPGSYSLSQHALSGSLASVSAGKPSYYAAAGTVAHSLAEQALTDPKFDLWGEDGTVVDVEGHTIPVNQELLAIVDAYVTWAEKIMPLADYGQIEVHVDLMPYWGDDPDALDYPPVPIFGTADLLAYSTPLQHLVVGDLKSGAGINVSAYENPQLFAYAAGALLMAPGPVRTVTLAIIQPAVSDDESVYVKEYQVTALDVEMWVGETLKPAIAAALTPGAKVNPGKWCQFCAAKPICPALYNRAMAAAKEDFADETLVSPVDLSPVEMGRRLNEAYLVETWAGAMKSEAKARLAQDANAIPGWMARARTIRDWDPGTPTKMLAGRMADVLPELRLDPSKAWDTKLKSPAALERLVGKKLFAAHGHVLNPYIIQKPAGVVLTPTGSPASTGASEGED